MNKPINNHFFRFFQTVWLFCLVFVSIGSILPGTALFQPIMSSDKLLHLIAYAGLALLQPLFIKESRLFIRCAVLLVLWGIFLEGAQGFVPNRFPSFWDFVANTVGVLVGTWAGIRIRKRLYRPESS